MELTKKDIETYLSIGYVECLYCETAMKEEFIIDNGEVEICPICGSVGTLKDIKFLEKFY